MAATNLARSPSGTGGGVIFHRPKTEPEEEEEYPDPEDGILVDLRVPSPFRDAAAGYCLGLT